MIALGRQALQRHKHQRGQRLVWLAEAEPSLLGMLVIGDEAAVKNGMGTGTRVLGCVKHDPFTDLKRKAPALQSENTARACDVMASTAGWVSLRSALMA